MCEKVITQNLVFSCLDICFNTRLIEETYGCFVWSHYTVLFSLHREIPLESQVGVIKYCFLNFFCLFPTKVLFGVTNQNSLNKLNCCLPVLKTENLHQCGNPTKRFPCAKKRKNDSFVRKNLSIKMEYTKAWKQTLQNYACTRKYKVRDLYNTNLKVWLQTMSSQTMYLVLRAFS